MGGRTGDEWEDGWGTVGGCVDGWMEAGWCMDRQMGNGAWMCGWIGRWMGNGRWIDGWGMALGGSMKDGRITRHEPWVGLKSPNLFPFLGSSARRLDVWRMSQPLGPALGLSCPPPFSLSRTCLRAPLSQLISPFSLWGTAGHERHHP